eukprot:12092-Heterococcus_DN1.PRE.1
MAPAGKQIVALALVGAACGAQAFHAPSQFVGQRIVAPRAVAHASGQCNRTAQQAIFIVRLLFESLQHCALIYKHQAPSLAIKCVSCSLCGVAKRTRCCSFAA